MSFARQDLAQSEDQSDSGPSDLTNQDHPLDSVGSTVHLSDSDTRDFAYLPGTQVSRPAPYGFHRPYCGEPLQTIPDGDTGSEIPSGWQGDLELQGWKQVTTFPCEHNKKYRHVVLAYGFAKSTSVSDRAELKSKTNTTETNPKNESELSVPLDGISFWCAQPISNEQWFGANNRAERLETRAEWTEVARLCCSGPDHLPAAYEERRRVAYEAVSSYIKDIICTRSCPATKIPGSIQLIVTDPRRLLKSGSKHKWWRKPKVYSIGRSEGSRRFDGLSLTSG